MSSTTAFELRKLQNEYGARALDNEESRRPAARGFKIANGRLGTQIRPLNERCSRLKERIRALPKRVAVGEAEGETIVSLDPPHGHDQDGGRSRGDGPCGPSGTSVCTHGRGGARPAAGDPSRTDSSFSPSRKPFASWRRGVANRGDCTVSISCALQLIGVG